MFKVVVKEIKKEEIQVFIVNSNIVMNIPTSVVPSKTRIGDVLDISINFDAFSTLEFANI